jgi:hypothetical protein
MPLESNLIMDPTPPELLMSLFAIRPFTCSLPRFDSFAPAHSPLPSRLFHLCRSFPNCSIRQRWFNSVLLIW